MFGLPISDVFCSCSSYTGRQYSASNSGFTYLLVLLFVLFLFTNNEFICDLHDLCHRLQVTAATKISPGEIPTPMPIFAGVVSRRDGEAGDEASGFVAGVVARRFEN